MEKDLNGIEYILMLILERIKETGVSQNQGYIWNMRLRAYTQAVKWRWKES